MRASIPIRKNRPHRDDARRGTVRGTAIALAMAACHLASTHAPFVAKVHAQIPLPEIPSAPDPKDLVHAELVADVDAIASGRPFRLAVRLVIKDGWHVNWLNPGDAGLAPGIEWKVPAGYRTSVMCWPYPERFPSGPLVIFGYAKELILVTEVTPPKAVATGTRVQLGAEVSWLACEEVCIPGSASLALALGVEDAARANAQGSARIEESRKRCPVPAGTWSVDAGLGDGATLLLDLQTAEESGAILNSVFFYPYDPGVIENGAPQLLSVLEGPYGRSAYQLRVELWRMATQVPERARGVLVMDRGGMQAIEVDVPVRTR